MVVRLTSTAENTPPNVLSLHRNYTEEVKIKDKADPTCPSVKIYGAERCSITLKQVLPHVCFIKLEKWSIFRHSDVAASPS